MIFSLGLTISLGFGYRIMAPTSFKNLIKTLKKKMKSTSPRCSETLIEDKSKWQKLVRKCKDDPLIESETQPPLFDEN
jgi:predicted acetyltransferase